MLFSIVFYSWQFSYLAILVPEKVQSGSSQNKKLRTLPLPPFQIAVLREKKLLNLNWGQLEVSREDFSSVVAKTSFSLK